MTSQTPELRVAERADGVLVLVGELDANSCAVLADRLYAQLAAGSDEIILDAAGLTFCDSTGLGLFVEVNSALRGARGLLLRHTTPSVRRLLEITGLAGILTEQIGARDNAGPISNAARRK